MKNIIGIIFVLLLSFFSVRPLFSSGYFPMHDDTQVARVVVMGKALRQGQFPVRWVSDLGYGYGYPIFNFYAPLPYYIGGGLYALGVDSIVATKIMFGVGMVIAPLMLFILVNSFFGFLAALTASMLFLYAPYHAVEVYVRGSVGEYWAIAFVPLLLYGLTECAQKKRSIYGVIIGGLSFAGVILSHTILGFITCLFLGIGTIVYWAILITQKKFTLMALLRPIQMCVLGLGLSAFFWLPAFVEMSKTSVIYMVEGANSTFFDHFVCVDQLWNSPWGYAGSAPGCVDGMSFKLGKVQIITLIISFITWLVVRKKKYAAKKNSFMFISFISFCFGVFLVLNISQPVWDVFPFVSYIQYPWRLLSFNMLFLAICGAYIVSVPRMPIVRIGLMVGIIALTIFVNAKIFVPQYLYLRDSAAFETQQELRFTVSKISDEYLPPGIMKPQTASDAVKTALHGSDVFTVKKLEDTDTSLYVDLESSVAQIISIRKAWFPGWKISINGNEIHPIIRQGIPFVNILPGKSIIQMRFTDTPIRFIGNILSLCSVLVLGGLYVYRNKTKA